DRRNACSTESHELQGAECRGEDEDRGKKGRRGEYGDQNHDRVDDRGDRAPRKVSHYRPNRRSRLAYDASAWSRSATEKSGHSTSVAHISAYATSHSRKFETRSSPPVRMSRSGSGWS